jgi:hypothetical protein
VFGVLLGRECDPARAAQIADSVAALQASRRETAVNATATQAAPGEASADRSFEPATAGSHREETADRDAHAARAAHGKREEAAGEVNPPGGLGGLWFQFLNGLKF